MARDFSLMTATDFRRHLSSALMRAKGGETIVITHRGRPIMEVKPSPSARPTRQK